MGTTKTKDTRGIKVYYFNLPDNLKAIVKREKDAYEKEFDRHCSYQRAVLRLLNKLA
jgi:hypothetical protein